MKSLKILKLKPEIDSHDLSTKLNSASKQLQKCHPVKIVIEKGDSSVFQKRKVGEQFLVFLFPTAFTFS